MQFFPKLENLYPVSKKELKNGGATEKVEYMDFLRILLEAGTLTLIIDKRYTLENIAEALRYVDNGHKK
ncbi:MAG: hypothetical protein EAX91_01365 [Candidatus Lokiarchaeota archaeon]|nr:hypothetical protein [Candidatus Lokiarchaeota archaeon]